MRVVADGNLLVCPSAGAHRHRNVGIAGAQAGIDGSSPNRRGLGTRRAAPLGLDCRTRVLRGGGVRRSFAMPW